jgi:hypothetical protein
MGSPKAQHEFLCELMGRYPWLIHPIAAAAGVTLPQHERLEAGPTAHRLKDGKTVHADATVRLMRGDSPVHFTQVEVQREYAWKKLATLRAYHGSEVRKSGCGGRVFVLSPRAEVSERFVENEARAREELAFQVSFVPATGLAALREPTRELPERALATALCDFGQGLPAGSLALVTELRQADEFMADLLFDAILEGCPDDRKVEEAMSPETLARLEGLPSFRAWQERARTAGLEEGRHEGLQEGLQQGLHQGRQLGESVGLLKGKAQTLLQFFHARRDPVPTQAVTEIIACSDSSVLDGWLDRAFNGETAEQIFG